MPPGARLPSTRLLAETLGVARITVARAFDDLAAAGFVVGRRGSGTYVVDVLSTGGDGPARESVSPRLSLWAQRALAPPPPDPPPGGAPTTDSSTIEVGGWHRGAPDAAEPTEKGTPSELPFDFRPGAPDWDAFPRRVWWRLVGRRLRAGGALDRYGDPIGYPPLREAIARHLAASRAVACRPEQIAIVNGTQQSLDLLARLLLEPGDRVVVEDPGYPEARMLFAAYGADLRPLPVDGGGLPVDALDATGARVVYVTPSHQFPTGVSMPLERRRALLAWAEARDGLVIEDDYDSELRYAESPVESLQSLDRSGRVIYLGTFSTVLFPPLRVGYVVLPDGLIEPFGRAKWLADRGTGTLEQQALADFIVEGHFGRHLRRMRRLGRRRRDALLEALVRHLGGLAERPGADTGVQLLLRLPGRDAGQIAAAARRLGVGVYPAAPYYLEAPPDRSALLLGFGAIDVGAIDEGIRRLAQAARA